MVGMGALLSVSGPGGSAEAAEKKDKADRAKNREARLEKAFAKRDADGKVTLDEWKAAMPDRAKQNEKRMRRVEKMFDRMDADQSSDLTIEKFKQGLKKAREHHKDRSKADKRGQKRAEAEADQN